MIEAQEWLFVREHGKTLAAATRALESTCYLFQQSSEIREADRLFNQGAHHTASNPGDGHHRIFTGADENHGIA